MGYTKDLKERLEGFNKTMEALNNSLELIRQANNTMKGPVKKNLDAQLEGVTNIKKNLEKCKENMIKALTPEQKAELDATEFTIVEE